MQRHGPIDLPAFVAQHQELLALERREELAQQERLLAEQNEAELEDAGVLLRRLQPVDLEPGLGGLVEATLISSKKGDLPAHRFLPGDVVALDGGKDTPRCNGIVAAVKHAAITVAFDGELELDLPPLCRLLRLSPDLTFRRMHEALQGLLRAPEPNRRQLREVCFAGRAPAFDERRTPPLPLDARLDDCQRRAVLGALAAEHVALIHGPPGTGKTTAIAELLRQSVARGETVLAAAPSNVAVDNLAERLIAMGLQVVRIGQPVRMLDTVASRALPVLVHEAPEQKLRKDCRRQLHDVRRRWLRASREERRELRDEQRRLTNELRTLERAIVRGILDEADVVLATLTGAGDALLQGMPFDLVVIDEAAQAFEAAAWIAGLRGQKLVLAGDHCQLPPTVMSQQAKADGLDVTLFERLAQGPFADALVLPLTTQHRMHRSIQRWSNERFYGGRLVPSPKVAEHLLHELPDVAVDDATMHPLLFLDTAGCGHDETTGDEEGSKSNPGEAAIAAAHVRLLLDAGVKATDIAVIAPYTAQVRKLRERLGGVEGLEIGSIDGLQGREKEAVVLSLVRSNERGENGFLRELRRLNVALTRARRHLCVIGDSATLAQDDGLASLVDCLQQQGEHRSAWGLADG